MTNMKNWAETNGSGRNSCIWGLSGFTAQLIAIIGTLLIMIFTPLLVNIIYHIHSNYGGSTYEFINHLLKYGNLDSGKVSALWNIPSQEASFIFITFGIIEVLLQLYLPGKYVKGPVTPKGNIPIYKANGVLAYMTTLILFFLSWKFNIFEPARIYDIFGEILNVLNIFGIIFCLLLYLKGCYLPSSSDSGTTGNIIYDFYWGMELYPRIGKNFDIKTWTNCRIGMMSWAVLILCFAAKQIELYGSIADSMLISIILMQIYIFKFFVWEAGYWCSMDISHDRAGYYLCWGCLNWVPGVYTSPALYLVNNPVHLGIPMATAILLSGILCIYINYDADHQRQEFRRNRHAKIWGNNPRFIKAEYKTGDGEIKTSLLLASGWWGIARHFHYVPEILGAFLWTVPSLFNHGLPYFYVVYLLLLLTDRAYRDDQKCRSKYGQYWKKYCSLVPFKMIPGIF